MTTYAPGTLIANRYEVASRPMLGGMGIVYICLDRDEDRPVALKTFKPEYLPDRTARDRFLREGTHWVDLGAHPHIVRCYQVVRVGDGTEVYLVLELIAKEQGYPDASLRSWLISGQPLPVEPALLFTLQIARGMQYAAETIPGFAHLDLKPENLLVGADRLSGWSVNRLRITDFGLAGVLQSLNAASFPATSNQQPESSNEQPATRTQLTHGIVGTPLYMAPEQWRGEAVGVYTDIYALGCILQEMLTGQRAAVGNSLTALRQAHCTGDLQPLPSSLHPAVRDLTTCCTALEAGARYPTWNAVLAALEAAYVVVAGQPAPLPVPAVALTREERVAHGWSYNALGVAYADLGKAIVAVSYFERAIDAGEYEGEVFLRGAALGNLGNAYVGLGEVRRAIGYHEQSLVISREIGDRRGEGVALGNLGNAYKDLGEVRRAIGYYEQCLMLHREIGDQRGESSVLNNLGLAYIDLGDVQRAIDYHKQVLMMARVIGDQGREGQSLGNLGQAYLALGDAPRAINYLEQRLEKARELGNLHGESNALGNLGVAYKQLGDLQRAIGYYEQRIEIAREIGDRQGEGHSLCNLGNIYNILKDVQSAISYYEQALKIDHEIEDRQGEAQTAWNLGVLYAKQGDLARAADLMQICVDFEREIGHPDAEKDAAQLAHIQMGRAADGSIPPAANAMQQVFKTFQHTNTPAAMRKAVTQYPLMTDPDFIAAVERAIKEQIPPEHKSAFVQRLAWLREIINEEKTSEAKSRPGWLGRLFGKK